MCAGQVTASPSIRRIEEAGSHRYPVEEFQLSVSPSAAIYLRCLDRYRRLGNASAERVLVVANPRLDRTTAARFAFSSPRRTVRRATWQAFGRTASSSRAQPRRQRRVVAEAPASSVIHFASHAPGGGELDPLEARPRSGAIRSQTRGFSTLTEIPALRLPRTRIVILAACETLRWTTARRRGDCKSRPEHFSRRGFLAVIGTPRSGRGSRRRRRADQPSIRGLSRGPPIPLRASQRTAITFEEARTPHCARRHIGQPSRLIRGALSALTEVGKRHGEIDVRSYLQRFLCLRVE